MAPEKTKTIEAIEEKMRQVPPGSYRWQVLAAARDFKNAWIELGAHLVKVRDGGLYKEWGYEDFETWCQRELHIRKATAHKLTATYGFMERHEPVLLQQAQEDPEARARIPDFEVFQVLSKAEEKGQISDERYQEVREKVFDDRPPSPAGLARVINAAWPPPPKPEPADDVRIKKLAAAMGRIADEMHRTEAVPEAIRERAAALAQDLTTLLEEGAWRRAG